MSSSPTTAPAATVFEAFEATARDFPSHAFLHVPASAARGYAPGPLDFSYAEAAAQVQPLRERYAALGVAGRRVALMLENRPAFLFHWIALNACGASIVPLNPDYRAAELSHLLAHSECALAVVLGSHLARVRDAAGGACAVLDAAAFDDGAAALPALAPAGAPVQQDECALVYTSGTTGKPKGCVLSNEYFLLSGERYLGRRGYVELEVGRSRVLTPLPLFHINALASSTMGMIMSAGCVIQLDRFHPRSFWADVVSSGATGLHCLGVMPAILLGLPEAPEERAHRLRYATAANVEPQHHAAFEARFGVPLVEGWSMTETGAGAAISADAEPRHVGTRCLGRELPALEVRLVDEDGAEVAPGEPGEMLVRRRSGDPRRGFFSGYLKDPEATDAAWRDGWWHTGDVVRRGSDGSLHFVDRIKNLIRRSGENISALEVEQVLRRCPGVADAAVTSVADPLRGEEVFACIVPGADAPRDDEAAQRIVAWTLGQLAYYKAPGWVAFASALPTTASQKLERGALRRDAAQRLSEGECIDTRALKRRDGAAA